jgi:hypothetical protein
MNLNSLAQHSEHEIRAAMVAGLCDLRERNSKRSNFSYSEVLWPVATALLGTSAQAAHDRGSSTKWTTPGRALGERMSIRTTESYGSVVSQSSSPSSKRRTRR